MSEIADRLREAARALTVIADRADAGEVEREDLESVAASIARAQGALFGPRRRRSSGASARDKILEYLQLHVGHPVLGKELADHGAWRKHVPP